MRQRQLLLALSARPRWGGARRGAGRKRAPGRRPSVPHRVRPAHDGREPALVTLRACREVVWLRTRVAYRALRNALACASRDDFCVVHYSVQRDHLHLIVEADGKAALSRGMRGLAIRCALAVNRALGRRGALWADRYHAMALRTPRMVRNALVYVLANAAKPVGGGRPRSLLLGVVVRRLARPRCDDLAAAQRAADATAANLVAARRLAATWAAGARRGASAFGSRLVIPGAQVDSNRSARRLDATSCDSRLEGAWSRIG